MARSGLCMPAASVRARSALQYAVARRRARREGRRIWGVLPSEWWASFAAPRGHGGRASSGRVKRNARRARRALGRWAAVQRTLGGRGRAHPARALALAELLDRRSKSLRQPDRNLTRSPYAPSRYARRRTAAPAACGARRLQKGGRACSSARRRCGRAAGAGGRDIQVAARRGSGAAATEAQSGIEHQSRFEHQERSQAKSSQNLAISSESLRLGKMLCARAGGSGGACVRRHGEAGRRPRSTRAAAPVMRDRREKGVGCVVSPGGSPTARGRARATCRSARR